MIPWIQAILSSKMIEKHLYKTIKQRENLLHLRVLLPKIVHPRYHNTPLNLKVPWRGLESSTMHLNKRILYRLLKRREKLHSRSWTKTKALHRQAACLARKATSRVNMKVYRRSIKTCSLISSASSVTRRHNSFKWCLSNQPRRRLPQPRNWIREGYNRTAYHPQGIHFINRKRLLGSRNLMELIRRHKIERKVRIATKIKYNITISQLLLKIIMNNSAANSNS